MRGAVEVNEALLSRASRLRVLIRVGSGIEHIDRRAVRRRGIRLYRTPQANAAAVAEYVIAALISLSRRFLPAHHALRESDRWERRASVGRELSSLKVGIIGFGENGSRTAYLLSTLGAQVLVYDRYKGGFGGRGIREASLKEIFREVEALSLHIPLTPLTRGWVDANFFGCFHHPIAFINASRGEIVVLSDLLAALEEGRVWGAALDTFPTEPPQNLPPEQLIAWEKLRRHPAVLLTPHIAGVSQESEWRLARAVLVLLRSLLKGSKP